MKPKRTFTTLAAALTIVFSAPVLAQTTGVSLAIEKHAVLTQQGAVVMWIHITCGPFAGVEDFQQGFAGGSQRKTGAEGETGIDGTVVCDGVERTHTARLSSFTDARFKRGPASVSVSFTVCMLVGDEQMCFSGSASRRVIIRGGPLQ
jgi:hypothetical protein